MRVLIGGGRRIRRSAIRFCIKEREKGGRGAWEKTVLGAQELFLTAGVEVQSLCEAGWGIEEWKVGRLKSSAASIVHLHTDESVAPVW